MGSYQQVVVGGMLLLVAFFFGKFVTSQKSTSTSEPDIASAQLIQPQETTDESIGEASNENAESLQRSLRERILGERAKDRSALKSNLDSVSKASDSTLKEKLKLEQPEIVEPDFSHLELKLPSLPPANPVTTPFELPSVQKQTATTQKSGGPGYGFSIKPKPDVNLKLRNDSPVKNLMPAPNRDSITRRGVINIGPPVGKMIPVQTKKAKLTLEQREYVDYTTVFGDTLHSLSIKFFGRSDYYLDIYLANRDLLENPSEVPVNTKLRIPVLESLAD